VDEIGLDKAPGWGYTAFVGFHVSWLEEGKMPQINNASEAFALITDNFDASKAAGVDGSILLDLAGEGGGQWAIKIAGGACEVIEGGVESPTTRLSMNAEDFVGMVNGTVNVMAAFMQGKIKLEGDMGLAMKFQSIFGLA
jgi:putative sterol carrier protein